VSARRFDRAAAIGVGVLVVTLTVVASFVGSGGGAGEGSAEFEGDEGRLALFLLFERLGLEPELWNEAPGLLPRGDHVLWLAEIPRSLQHRFVGDEWIGYGPPEVADEAPEAADEAPEAADEAPEAADETPEAADEGFDGDQNHIAAAPREVPFVLHDLTQYGDFVREGGTLVLPAGEETARALTETLGLAELEGLGALDGDRVQLERLFRGVEELAFDDSVRLLKEPAAESLAEELVMTEDGGWFALAVAVGAGRVVLLADDGFLDNPAMQGFLKPPPRGLVAADHALLAARLFEELDRGGRLLFDEYALGRWVPDSAVGLASTGRRGILTLQLVLFLLLLAWSAIWVREFPRDPEGLARLSPLSRARAQASLLGRARRWDLLAGMLRRGSLRRLCELARIRAVGEPQAGDEAWKEWAEKQLDSVLGAAGAEDERVRCTRLIFGPPPRGADELDQLASAFDALERDLGSRIGGSGRAGSHAGGSGPRRTGEVSGIVAGAS